MIGWILIVILGAATVVVFGIVAVPFIALGAALGAARSLPTWVTSRAADARWLIVVVLALLTITVPTYFAAGPKLPFDSVVQIEVTYEGTARFAPDTETMEVAERLRIPNQGLQDAVDSDEGDEFKGQSMLLRAILENLVKDGWDPAERGTLDTTFERTRSVDTESRWWTLETRNDIELTSLRFESSDNTVELVPSTESRLVLSGPRQDIGDTFPSGDRSERLSDDTEEISVPLPGDAGDAIEFMLRAPLARNEIMAKAAELSLSAIAIFLITLGFGILTAAVKGVLGDRVKKWLENRWPLKKEDDG